MLKVSKLNKYYRRAGKKPLHVINNTSLEIPEKGIIAVVGASGAGKTTLINTISGLDSFHDGVISFDDVSVKHYRTHVADKLRMKNFGFIFQNYYLLESETVYENVKVALDAFSISEEEKKTRIIYVLNQLGIGKYAHKLVTSLSGGEQQRVSIARALVKSPRIIFADEPTGSLDEKTTFNVLNILKKVSKTCAVFIVTHEREIISYYADYILELDDGVVVKEFIPEVAPGKRLAVDKNIYLGELDHKNSLKEEGVIIDLYKDESKVETVNQIKIAIKNEKVYLQSSNDIKVFTSISETQLVDGKPKEIRDYVNDDFDYQLSPLDYNDNHISLKKTLARGYHNYQSKRPIKRLFKATCALLSLVLMSLIQENNIVKNADLSDVLTASKGNLYLEVIPTKDDMNTSKMNHAIETICEEVEKSSELETLFSARDTLEYQYNGFYQIQNKKFTVPAHDFKNITTFDESTLVYGRLPEKSYEIIVDEYVLEKFVDSTLLSKVVTDYGHFIDKVFTSIYTNIGFTVCGVCRTKSPTIYGDISVNIARTSYDTRSRIIDFEIAKKTYPYLFKDLVLEKGHYLVNNSYLSKDFLRNNFIRDFVMSDDYPYDLVVNKEDYSFIKKIVCTKSNYMYVQTNGENSVINKAKQTLKDIENSLANEGVNIKIEVTNQYQKEFDKTMATVNSIILILQIVSIIAAIMAVVSVGISTYLSMMSQITDIAVYRSLGYSRLNLGFTYFIELLLTALKYIAIGGAVTYLSMFIIDLIPIVDFVLITPIWEFLVLLLALLGAIVLIGLVPIIIVFRRTPANLYNRFNRKVNN